MGKIRVSVLSKLFLPKTRKVPYLRLVMDANQRHIRPSLVYLAVPYSHTEREMLEIRFQAVNRVAGILMSKGEHVFSPISHSHPIADMWELPRSWEFWEGQDRAILVACRKLAVLMLDGWKESSGVSGELEIAREIGVDIEFLHPHDYGLEVCGRLKNGTGLAP